MSEAAALAWIAFRIWAADAVADEALDLPTNPLYATTDNAASTARTRTVTTSSSKVNPLRSTRETLWELTGTLPSDS